MLIDVCIGVCASVCVAGVCGVDLALAACLPACLPDAEGVWKWTAQPSLTDVVKPRNGHVCVSLGNGSVLLCGGEDGSAELDDACLCVFDRQYINEDYTSLLLLRSERLQEGLCSRCLYSCLRRVALAAALTAAQN